MSIFWIVVTFIFTLSIVALVAIALFAAATGDRGDHVEEPTVDAGWREWRVES